MPEDSREELLKRVRYGYRVAFAGLVIQLVGVAWDALLHHFDPDQATKESVFGFTNPSYLLIVLGMGLTVAGAAWWMFFLPGSRRSGFRLFGGPVLAAAILVALSLLTSGIAIATGGLSVRQEQQSEDTTYLVMGAMGDVGHRIVADDPMLIELEETLISDGTKAALDRLEELAAKDEGFSGSHQYAHELGRFSYAHRGGDVVEAFRMCDGRFQGGCYHGALQAYFEDDPDFEADDLPGFCEGGVIDARATGMLKYNCLHGLGHGLSLFFDHDLREPLRYCDFLRTDWDRDSCYNGVFMENMVFSQDQHDQQGRAGQGGSLEDPHYPCNSVADRYKRECYAYQPMTILLHNGRDFDSAFEECDEASKPYVAACYRGMGKAISSLTRWDPDESRELCTLGAASHRIWCFEGVVTVLVSDIRRTGEAADFCSGAPSTVKSRCFELIGEMVPELHADTASRNEECEKAQEKRWITICRRSAGLGGWSEDEML